MIDKDYYEPRGETAEILDIAYAQCSGLKSQNGTAIRPAIIAMGQAVIRWMMSNVIRVGAQASGSAGRLQTFSYINHYKGRGHVKIHARSYSNHE